MAQVSRARLREILEESMLDVAMVSADMVSIQGRLLEIRARCAEVWGMADLGDDLPEFEVQARVAKVS